MEALFVAAEDADPRERLYVAQRLREEDVEVTVWGADVEGQGYDFVHVTGGERGDEERRSAAGVVRQNADEGALVTAAGEGVRVLAEAGVAEDRQVAAVGGVAEVVRDAGGRPYEEDVIVDAKVVTTLGGGALAEFGAEVVRKVRRSRLKDL